MKKTFICASRIQGEPQHPVAAPYLRKGFTLDFVPEKAKIKVCTPGFYRFFVNGKEITRGKLAPYIANPDHFLYYDEYEIAPLLHEGKNAFGAILGNGFFNNPGGFVWDFDLAPWRGAPMIAVEAVMTGEGKSVTLTADETWRTCPSPIIFDDLRMGEKYDFTRVIDSWADADFDDTLWDFALLPARIPRGRLRKNGVEPILPEKELTPVSVTKLDGGFLYDFGENTAGTFRFTVSGAAGQKVTIRLGEQLRDGRLDQTCLRCGEVHDIYDGLFHKVELTYGGGGKVTYEPSFTYFGARYAFVSGITEEQAAAGAFTFIVCHSALKKAGGFTCSDKTVNTLMEMIGRTDMANFFYFPTDCPHREKNGWTGDASVSADHLTYLYDARRSYRQWIMSICASQNEEGAIPGIVPTDTWGFRWGNGPAWDSAMTELPWQLYKKWGDVKTAVLCADTWDRYLTYIMGRREEDGTITIGLGDWVPVFTPASVYDTPVKVTSTLYVMDMAGKMSRMLTAAGEGEKAAHAERVHGELRRTFREKLIDFDTMTVAGRTQTAQCMALSMGAFHQDEEQRAFSVLLDLIHEKGDVFDCGMLGLHCLFETLARFGAAEMAWKLIMNDKFPSFALLPEWGYTSFPEKFCPKDSEESYAISHNHHLFCDVARFFIESAAGLIVTDHETVLVKPCFLSSLTRAEAYHVFPAGRVSVGWKRKNGSVCVTVKRPKAVRAVYELPEGAVLTEIIK